jgi:hypothetical protein
VTGLVRKKKPSVMWKSEMDVRIVLAEMSAMATVVVEGVGRKKDDPRPKGCKSGGSFRRRTPLPR